MKKVALIPLEDYDTNRTQKALDEAFDLLGGLEEKIRPGMRVLVKANLLRRAVPEECITTHPAVVEALCRKIAALGATAVIGDSPGGPFYASLLRGVYSRTGMALAAERSGAQLNYDVSAGDVRFERGKALKELNIASMAIEADAIISVAKMKTHGLTGFTGAVKNLFGIVPGTVKVEYHARFPHIDDFADMLVDVAEYAAPVYSVIDAVEAMEGEGPSSGDPVHAGALIVSDNAHAADAVAISMMNILPVQIPTFARAADRGLIRRDCSDVEVCGEEVADMIVEDFVIRLPKTTQTDFTHRVPRFLQGIAQRLLRVKPVFDDKTCTGCGVCAESCPPKTVKMLDGRPDVDLSACIRCFCCQELCPRHCVHVHRPLLVRWIR
ncbi:MAG: DUF362 domain-containing protein [Christensenellales bacterium]|jgi:uncharacterized protein (DUF362 family)/Pyruvate/2-oxoacid:ferredoxin oxidoreductase delta subunit